MRWLLLLWLWPLGAAAQQTRTLGKPDFEHKEPFTQIASLRELRDGRLIVLDSRENTLQLIDPKSSQAAPIGSEGSGPSEWRRPTNVYALPGDSTLVQDPPNGRFLILGPDGKPARIFRPEGGGGGTLRATDVRGQMYYQAPLVVTNVDGSPAFPDSIPVMRYDPATHRHDTLAFVAVPPRRVNASTSSAGPRTVVGVTSPFDPVDDWTVLPDGRLIIVRTADYHVEIMGSNGQRVVGKSVPFTSFPVTGEDKERWRAARRNVRPTFLGRDGQPIAPPANFQIPEPIWPERKPAFASGAARVAPNGEIWVLRNRASSDVTPVFDVFNARGERTGNVTLPARTSLVGFGARHLYLVRTDEDDLQYLQRYPL
ncbi:MAG: hypothetical protein ACRENP_07995 [Longimicrobiales bacterium]